MKDPNITALKQEQRERLKAELKLYRARPNEAKLSLKYLLKQGLIEFKPASEEELNRWRPPPPITYNTITFIRDTSTGEPDETINLLQWNVRKGQNKDDGVIVGEH